MVAGQRLHAGRTYAETIVTVLVEDHHLRVLDCGRTLTARQNYHDTDPRIRPTST
nr:hypothetical protein [Rhodococcus sp. 06-621-2]